MGLLAEIFSASDTAKRRLRGLLDDPAGTLGLGATRAVEDQAGLLGLMDQAGVTPGSNSVLLDNKKRAAQQLADKALESFGGLLGATVWHGSPHKFDKFDSSKIGTGEGAQAYGHGLYLAEAPDTAQAYANKLTQVDGRAISDQLDSRVRYLNTLKQQAAAGDTNAAKTIPVMEKSIADLKNQGSLYKVDLPDDQIAKMLDWDKPLSQQPQGVQAWLKDPYNPYKTQLTAKDVGGNEPTGSLIMNRLQELMSEGKKSDAFTNQANFGAANASREIGDFGIPGIRYLDGGSRGAGGGTSNFVVFPGNEGLLQILERNGQPIK